MGQYRDSLIRAELETMKAQAQLFAGAIAEGAVKPAEKGTPLLFATPEEIETLVPELSRRMVRRLGETTGSRTRLFDSGGVLIGDSHQLAGPGGVVQIAVLDPPRGKLDAAMILRILAQKLLDLLPIQNDLKPYPAVAATGNAKAYPDAADALRGDVGASAWTDEKGGIVLTAAAPVQKIKQVLGVVLLSRDGKEIEEAMTRVRFDVLTVFLGALSVTIFLSMYLAGIIGRPLKKLARAAESIRQGKSRRIDIPDLTHRRDEIGELSQALRDMTQALWDRMDSIERFAADVAHEIKNPLTSLRSAVETAARVSSDADRQRLMDIIQHDVRRLDRLITDISKASRLDAELSRDEMGAVDLRDLLEQLAGVYKELLDRRGEKKRIVLEMPERGDIRIYGNEGRLGQVFENLIVNALSFAPSDSAIVIRALPGKNAVTVTVEDSGPGIPENMLETIFERFYTERPKHEDYGSHSGLGLSIARQIVEAHGGSIRADNARDGAGAVSGARFVVVLPAAS